METAVYFEKIVRNFSRYNKYTLGAEMRTKSRDIVKLIIKAIDRHINNCTALSGKTLDDVLQCTPYSDFSLWPCEINYVTIYSLFS